MATEMISLLNISSTGEIDGCVSCLFSCEEVCVLTQLLNYVSLFTFTGTPVHWAVLNGQVGALEILLQMGCSATPFKPKVNNRSSAAVESPMEMCERLYDPTNKGKGAEIQLLLLSHTKPQTEANTTPTPALV
jgi:hypothetical protein